MDSRRKKKSSLRQWILAFAVVILAFAVVPLQNYFESLKAKRAEVPVFVPKAIAVPPRAPPPPPTPAPTQPPKPSQAALDSMVATQAERSRYDGPLKMAEYQAKMELSEDEHRRLLDDVIDVEHVREELEQSLVAVDNFDGTTLSLKIPAYPEQGKTLKAALVAQIGQDFPAERTTEIAAAFDGSFDEMFGGFGMFSQAFTVTSLGGEDDRFQITFATTLPDPSDTPDPKTAAELGQLTGNGGGDRGGILSQWKAIAPQITSHFPP
ncbi:MAG TPA: hypothetical protein VII43_07005, partial [Opitutaceae bacterium]